jgi:hypothetical protein
MEVTSSSFLDGGSGRHDDPSLMAAGPLFYLADNSDDYGLVRVPGFGSHAARSTGCAALGRTLQWLNLLNDLLGHEL